MNEQLKTHLKEVPGVNWLLPYWRKIRDKAWLTTKSQGPTLDRAQYKHSAYQPIGKSEFLHDLHHAIERRIGYAAGKIGKTAQYMISYEMILQREINKAKTAEFESRLAFMCLNQQGIFPAENEFLRLYSEFYIKHIRNVDCLGICYYPGEVELLTYYALSNKLIHYCDQEPDQSSPSNEHSCYLPFFRDRILVIICPFGEILKERATQEIFEGVWSKSGKRWFYPKSVSALEFPYGFSRETQKVYPTVFELFDYITGRLHQIDFDVALIAAAGLAIPIASHIKDMGKVAIDLGGHLQIIFGVVGQRWRNTDGLKQVLTDHWIDMPAKYKPKETDVCDHGAYW